MYSARRVESMTTVLYVFDTNISYLMTLLYVSQTLGIQLWNVWANGGWCEACNVKKYQIIRSPESRTIGSQQPYISIWSIQYCTFCIGLQATTVLWLKLSNMPSVRRRQSAKANLSSVKGLKVWPIWHSCLILYHVVSWFNSRCVNVLPSVYWPMFRYPYFVLLVPCFDSTFGTAAKNSSSNESCLSHMWSWRFVRSNWPFYLELWQGSRASSRHCRRRQFADRHLTAWAYCTVNYTDLDARFYVLSDSITATYCNTLQHCMCWSVKLSLLTFGILMKILTCSIEAGLVNSFWSHREESSWQMVSCKMHRRQLGFANQEMSRDSQLNSVELSNISEYLRDLKQIVQLRHCLETIWLCIASCSISGRDLGNKIWFVVHALPRQTNPIRG